MDLSGIIFAALAVGWTVYLIPRALQRNEELAKTRAVSSFSGRMRVLGDGRRPEPEVVTEPEPEVVTATAPAPAPRRITRDAARRAARRRRRVLLVLVFALGTVSALAGFAIAPVWSPAIPGGLVLLFLITARLSVRRQVRSIQGAPAQVQQPDHADEDTQGIDVSGIREAAPAQASAPAASVEQPAPAASVEQPVADEGSLWDPLPVTLPTYVTKPTARRTVRTIALTQTTSSGHDSADSKLAREAEAARQAQLARDSKETPAVAEEKRKAAGA